MKPFTFAVSAMLAVGAAAAEGPTATVCEPKCRSGYTCLKGKCVSACNPPCAAGETCTAEGECIAAKAAPAAARPAPANGQHWDAEEVRLGVALKQQEVQACFEASLADHTVNISGDLFTSFVVGVDGSVKNAVVATDSTIYSPAVRDCVTRSLATLHFKPPADGVEHPVKVPFHLSAYATTPMYEDSGSYESEPNRPSTKHVVRKRLTALWIIGSIVELGLLVARDVVTLSYINSISNDYVINGWDWVSMGLPVVGGWMEIINLGSKNGITPGLALLSASEAIAVSLIVVGFVVHRSVEVDGPSDGPQESLWLVPSLGARSAGVAFGGRF